MAKFASELKNWNRPIPQIDKDRDDFTHLQPLLQDLLSPEVEREAQRQKIMKKCESGRSRTMARLKEAVKVIGDKLKAGGFPVGYNSPGCLRPSFFPGMARQEQTERQRMELFGAQAVIKKLEVDYSLWVGAALQYTWEENPTFVVHGVYWIEPPGLAIWNDSSSFLLDGPNEEHALAQLSNGLLENLGSAVDRYLRDCVRVSN